MLTLATESEIDMRKFLQRLFTIVLLGFAPFTTHAAGDINCWRSDQSFMLGMKATRPQRYALSFSAFIPINDNSPSLLLQAEPGYGGGKLNIGLGGACAGIITAGGAIKASLLRTWHDPQGIPIDQTYLGLELEVMCCFLNGSVGAYRRIDGHEGDAWIVSTGIGIGF
jgi:hypothetical protein